ncbi:BQ5605_C005g03538 [Microbotryum silenes-dioicae]|uniref:BQ5605_C005g03538 protein n=1 Tax=Microbotryum silenes-dioicae TaxID=796604 RepID=A0A2X0PCT6_9BASI|nr:BQ5605_C005g03538 [Microbotryum silenes-dioicae]
MRSKIRDFGRFYLRASGWAFMGPLKEFDGCIRSRSLKPGRASRILSLLHSTSHLPS